MHKSTYIRGCTHLMRQGVDERSKGLLLGGGGLRVRRTKFVRGFLDGVIRLLQLLRRRVHLNTYEVSTDNSSR